jgi:protein tyrosine phosphatase
MIWESNVQTIAVVTNFRSTSGKVINYIYTCMHLFDYSVLYILVQLQTKCSCYWPEVGYSANYGDITVKFEEELVLPDCTVRNFILVYYDEEPKSVTQFHFSGWPDHGVPTHATAFLNFINRVRDHQDHLATSSPMVVHCSAGVGRTGTFIVVDYSILWLKQENQVDIFNLVKEIRQQRPFLVQSLAQYIFCHDAILEVITCGDTSVESSNLRSYISIMKEIDQATGETGFAKQLKLLNRLIPPKECHVYPNIHENRKSANIYVSLDDSSVPENIPFQLSNSTWICATSADGRNLKRNSYITAQCPLKETVDDFWTLVWENDIELVVTLSRMEGNKETPMELNDVSAQYWPSEGTAEYNLVSVTLHDQKHMEDYAIRQFTVTDSEISRMVTQFHYKKWSSGTRNLPDHPSQLLHMISLLQKAQLQADNKTVVVISNNGVHQCGLFCAISIVVEFLKAQHRVDIFQVVKSLRIHNPVFITGLMEYEFCYDMALLFLETFTEKSTFKLV